MLRFESVARHHGRRAVPGCAVGLALAVAAPLLLLPLLLPTPARAAEPQPFRYEATIAVERAAPFVELPLPVAVYARSRQPGLSDLRLVDAAGERVPFAVLEPRSALRASAQERAATLYPLPPRPAGGSAWPSPVEVDVQGERITVRRRGGAAGTTASGASTASAGATARVDGWLVDTGERRSDEPPPRQLRLAWSGPAEFSTAYRLETSDDLRRWRDGGVGQLLALRPPGGSTTLRGLPPLMQPLVPLPDGAGRFVRLVWLDGDGAPALSGAVGLVPEQRRVDLDAPSELALPALTATAVDAAFGAGAASGMSGMSGLGVDAATARRSLVFDLGGALPLVDVRLQLGAGTRVAPVRLAGRQRADGPWVDLGSAVFYRLERDGAAASESPAVALPTTVRWLRVVADERTAALDPAASRLVVRARLARLVFGNGGAAPLRLLVGSADAPGSALPVTTLVPRFDEERERFGRATLGEPREIEAAARDEASVARAARLRPWLLWAVLVAGVAGLAVMVVRLARAPRPAPPSSSGDDARPPSSGDDARPPSSGDAAA